MFGQGLLIATFALAAGAKAWHRDAFLRRLTSIPWLPRAAAKVVARAVPLVEIGLVVALVYAPRIGAAAALVVLAGFSAVAVYEIGAGRDLRCGCFAGGDEPLPARWMLLRNCVLMAAAVLLLVVESGFSLGAALAGIGAGLMLVATEIALPVWVTGVSVERLAGDRA